MNNRQSNQNQKRVIGSIALTNSGGLAVLAIDEGSDRVQTQFFNGEQFVGKPGWNKIEYSRDGRPYFRKNGTRYYLQDIMRAY
jgi:hypothetical protein